ncbi:MAG: FlgD immunoglobulin-like domain containing protein [Candidatus Krumholzibacteriota bacterium]|nr:FlgD immunoglobulin-like domain containing protein [Candidatus Krumholzibacteriota bacterium]
MEKTTAGICTFLLLIVLSINVSSQETADYLVNWEPNPEPDITGYVIYRSLDRGAGFTAIDSVDNNTFEYLDEGLEKGTRYYYRLIAKNTSGERSGFSNPVSGMTIPADAAPSLSDSCKITGKSQTSLSSFRINWETPVATTGFIQYDSDAVLDSMSSFDETDWTTSHSNQLENLVVRKTYYARAAAYDQYDNLTISARDTLTVAEEVPAPVSSPQLNIYPVPYSPFKGVSMTMNGLPSNGAVRIFNSNGMEIHKETIPAGGEINWDGTNHNGSKVMSGVYYVIVEDSGGEVTEKRPVMIVN